MLTRTHDYGSQSKTSIVDDVFSVAVCAAENVLCYSPDYGSLAHHWLLTPTCKRMSFHFNLITIQHDSTKDIAFTLHDVESFSVVSTFIFKRQNISRYYYLLVTWHSPLSNCYPIRCACTSCNATRHGFNQFVSKFPNNNNKKIVFPFIICPLISFHIVSSFNVQCEIFIDHSRNRTHSHTQF